MRDSNSNGQSREEHFRPISRPSYGAEAFSALKTDLCDGCGCGVRWVTVREAADMYNTDVQDIVFLISQSRVHARAGFSRLMQVCRDSLAICFEYRRTRLLDSHFDIEAITRSFSSDIHRTDARA